MVRQIEEKEPAVHGLRRAFGFMRDWLCGLELLQVEGEVVLFDRWGCGVFGAAGADAFFFGDLPAGVFGNEDFDEAGFALVAAAVLGAGEIAPFAEFVGFGVGDAEPVLGVDLGAALGDEFLLGGAARDLRSAELAFEHDMQRVFRHEGLKSRTVREDAVERVRVMRGDGRVKGDGDYDSGDWGGDRRGRVPCA
jgi:hypothetical protein